MRDKTRRFSAGGGLVGSFNLLGGDPRLMAWLRFRTEALTRCLYQHWCKTSRFIPQTEQNRATNPELVLRTMHTSESIHWPEYLVGTSTASAARSSRRWVIGQSRWASARGRLRLPHSAVTTSPRCALGSTRLMCCCRSTTSSVRLRLSAQEH